MSYTKITNFAIKDTYLTGNPAKTIKGAEIDTEFNNIAAGFGSLGTEDVTITKAVPKVVEVMNPVSAGFAGLNVKQLGFDWCNIEVTHPDDKTYFRSYNPTTGTLRNTTTWDLVTGDWTFPAGVTAPTPPQFDNDTSLATTAFVQRALGNFSGWSTFTTSGAAIPAAAVGKVIQVQLVADGFVYLPLAAQCADGAALTIINTSSTTKCSLSVQVPDVLILPNITLLPGESVEVIASPGSNSWFVNAGGGALGKTAGFAASITTNGYQKLPSGLIIQWGAGAANATAGQPSTVTLPIAFSAGHLSTLVTRTSATVSADANSFAVDSTGLTSFVVRSQLSGSPTFRWSAFGW